MAGEGVMFAMKILEMGKNHVFGCYHEGKMSRAFCDLKPGMLNVYHGILTQ